MDTQLVIRALGGDEAAFDAVVDAAYGRLQQVAYRILRDPMPVLAWLDSMERITPS